MIFHENGLPADDSLEISCLICYFYKGSKILNCSLLQIIGGVLRVKTMTVFLTSLPWLAALSSIQHAFDTKP